MAYILDTEINFWFPKLIKNIFCDVIYLLAMISSMIPNPTTEWNTSDFEVIGDSNSKKF